MCKTNIKSKNQMWARDLVGTPLTFIVQKSSCIFNLQYWWDYFGLNWWILNIWKTNKLVNFPLFQYFQILKLFLPTHKFLYEKSFTKYTLTITEKIIIVYLCFQIFDWTKYCWRNFYMKHRSIAISNHFAR